MPILQVAYISFLIATILSSLSSTVPSLKMLLFPQYGSMKSIFLGFNLVTRQYLRNIHRLPYLSSRY
jgi:hypothetical protein